MHMVLPEIEEEEEEEELKRQSRLSLTSLLLGELTLFAIVALGRP